MVDGSSILLCKPRTATESGTFPQRYYRSNSVIEVGGTHAILACPSCSELNTMKRFAVRRSTIHGKGVFALRPMFARERIVEYKGMVTSWSEAARYCAQRAEDGHTFLFGLADSRVIDGARGGNSARWFNHACIANCEAVEEGGRVFFEAKRTIRPGEELFIDYALELPKPWSRKTLAGYRCHCGAKRCRGTMLGVSS
ncbi:SET domain-containing protein [Paraburkholderia acidisoli]|nr:SET domain-containing protein-lysine N-methyltransferase [Paraburkholderia acidisoli]